MKDWISIVIRLFGVIAGPVIAVRVSLKKFRSQKWWERQGETYFRLLENLAILKHCIKAELDYHQRPDYRCGPNNILSAQVAAASAEVNKIASMGPFYLSVRASEAANKFADVLAVDMGGPRLAARV